MPKQQTLQYPFANVDKSRRLHKLLPKIQNRSTDDWLEHIANLYFRKRD